MKQRGFRHGPNIYKATMFVYNLVKQKPGIRKSEIYKNVKIGINIAELDKIMRYLIEIKYLKKEEIEMEAIGLFVKEINSEEFYYCCKDAYRRTPMEMRKWL